MGIFSKKQSTKQPAEKKVAKVAKSGESAELSNFGLQIIIKPVVTEKAAVAQSLGKYTFVVSARANKQQIKTAVKSLYAVDAVAVNVVNVEGGRLRSGKNQGRHADYKKAVVTLKPGQTITMHEGV